MSDSNALVNLKPEHSENGFSHCRTSAFHMTPGLRAQVTSLEDTGENATKNLSKVKKKSCSPILIKLVRIRRF